VRLLDHHAATILSDPSLNTVWLLGNFENASSFFGIRAITSETSLAAISKIDALVATPIIVIVIVTARNPLHSLLLNNSAEETCIKRTA
jgi:hypothetical protein